MKTNSRRRFVTLAAMGAAVVALPWPSLQAAEAPAPSTRKPNVILILADDQGFADVGVQGCEDVPTPNIDSIAKNGVRFTNGYVSAPVCSPSRAGLLTGRYQERFGHDHNPHYAPRGWGLPLSQKTVAQYMKEQGYSTAAFGKWHLGDSAPFHPNKRGFDEFYGFIGGLHSYVRQTPGFNRVQRNGARADGFVYLTDALGTEAVNFIEKNKDRPFFIYLPFNAVHNPLDRDPKDKGAYTEINDPKRRRFASMLKSMDANIGRVLKEVRDAGLEKDTLIFYLSDNGGPTGFNTSRNDPFRGFKAQLWEGGIHIPFMMQWTGHIPAGKVDTRPVISIDLLPTAVSAAGGKAADNVDGVDLVPYLTGNKAGNPHETLCWFFDNNAAIRMGDWKLVTLENTPPALYNLAADVGESNDLAAKEPEKVKELSAAWGKWNAKNVAPLWPERPPKTEAAPASKTGD